MKGQVALVLGVTGFVGSALAKSLIEDGWKVFGAARLRNDPKRQALESLGIQLFPFDVTRDDPAKLPDVDTLFLEIWDPSRIDLIWPINFYGVGRVVERYAGKTKIINGCTINVYGDSPDPSSEETPCRPTSDYGRSRYAQEKLIDYFCVRSGGQGIHIRYSRSNTAKRGTIRQFAEAILAGQSLGANPDAKFQVIALEDFVRITKESLRYLASPPAVVNCCHPRFWSQRELAETLHARLGKGKVLFDREQGGLENSAYADTKRMCQWFGEPQIKADALLDRVVADLLN